MVGVLSARSIRYNSNIKLVKDAIPHLTEVAEKHLDAVSDENLIWTFISLSRFYQGQGLYMSEGFF